MEWLWNVTETLVFVQSAMVTSRDPGTSDCAEVEVLEAAVAFAAECELPPQLHNAPHSSNTGPARLPNTPGR